MQKKIVRKLTLSRETIAMIEHTALKQAAGALAPATQGPTESFGTRCFDCAY
jgi:hypothetical protein